MQLVVDFLHMPEAKWPRQQTYNCCENNMGYFTKQKGGRGKKNVIHLKHILYHWTQDLLGGKPKILEGN